MFYLFFAIITAVCTALKDPLVCANCKFAIIDKNNLAQSKCSLFKKTKIDCLVIKKSIITTNPIFEKIYSDILAKNSKIGDYFVTGNLCQTQCKDQYENKYYHDCLTARNFESMCGKEGKYYSNSPNSTNSPNSPYAPYEGTLV